MLAVQHVARLADLAALRDEWNTLLQRSGSDCIFLTWEWVGTWWEAYGDEFQLQLLTVREGERLVGIAPLMTRRGAALHTRPFRTLMFIGQDVDVTPEYLDLIIEAGRETAVVAAMVDFLLGPLRGEWDTLSLERMLVGSPNRPLLHAALSARLSAVQQSAPVDSPYAAFASSYAAFLQAKGSGFRRQLKNKRNRLERAGRVTQRWAGRDIGVDAALWELVRLNHDRWREAGTSFRSARYQRFHEAFARRAEERGWLALLLLELDDVIVAARYDFVYGEKIWCYQSGWSREHEELNLGDNALAAVIEWGHERGLREYDFLAGAAVYKDRWCTGRRALVDLSGYNPSWRGQAMSLLRRAKGLLREHVLSPAPGAEERRASERRLIEERRLMDDRKGERRHGAAAGAVAGDVERRREERRSAERRSGQERRGEERRSEPRSPLDFTGRRGAGR